MRSGPDKSMVACVLERAGYRCEACGKLLGETRGVDYSIHHRRPRGMGGTHWHGANLAPNLLAVCGSGTTGCHGWIETHRTEALAAGWLVSRYQDPSETPVQIGDKCLLLTNQATYAEVTGAAAS